MADEIIAATKRCSKCGQEKLASEFHWLRRDAALRMAECKACISARQRNRREHNHQKELDRERCYNASHRSTRAEYRHANAEMLAEKAKVYRYKNPERVRAATVRWRNEHIKEVREQQRLWRAKNPDYMRLAMRKRRALKRRASGELSVEDWRAIVSRSPRCHWCKRMWTKERRPTIDHVIPLSKGGAHAPYNVVCSCLSCNSAKRDRLANPFTAEAILL